MAAWIGRNRLQEIHVLVNSRFSDLERKLTAANSRVDELEADKKLAAEQSP